MPIGVILGLGSALLTALVTEIYAHRCLAHRAFRLSPRVAAVLDTYFRVVVGTDPETWAAVHRLHHRYADTPSDPHSPRLRSPLQVLLGSAYLFAVAKRQVPRDRPKGVRIMLIRAAVVASYVVLFGAAQVLLMFLVHLVGYLGIMGMVNTVGHLYGRKPHPEASGYDLGWLAIPLLGHGYHNSHHAHPAAARTGLLDPIWPCCGPRRHRRGRSRPAYRHAVLPRIGVAGQGGRGRIGERRPSSTGSGSDPPSRPSCSVSC